MAAPDTDNTSLLFVTRQPAWERGVTLAQTLGSNTFTSRSGLEQRTGLRHRSRWGMEYTAYLAKEAADARLLRAKAEMRAPLVIPFWPVPARTASTISANTVTITRASNRDLFTVGDYVYLHTDALGGQFRLIAGLGGTDQQIIFAALAEALDYPLGSRIYPCRIWTRSGDADTLTASESATEERLAFSTL